MIKHLISTNGLSKQWIEKVFQLAEKYEKLDIAHKLPSPLKNKIVACLFYEPSTRTRLSFETAVLKLSGGVISSENATQFSSAAKGETIEDTIRVVGNYADIIVMRHFEKGASFKAAEVSSVPIINAGDGTGEHPTQSLLDLFTIQNELGKINGLKIALIGDLLNGRTIHSLLNLLMLFKNIKIFLISPSQLRIPKEIKNKLIENKVDFEELNDFNKILKNIDVMYVTRIQKERFTSKKEYEKLKDIYKINNQTLKLLNSKAIIMHPLPRVGEIDPEIDQDSRAAYFRQAKNSLYIRMAILKLICEK